MPSQFRWLEVWDKPECDSGTRLAPIIARDVVLDVKTDFSDRLTFSVIPRSHAASHLIVGRVVRTRFTDSDDDDEYAIQIAAPSFGTNSNMIRVVCVPWVVWILTNCGTICTYNSGGIPQYADEVPGSTAASALDILLDFLSSTRGISYITAGSVLSTDPFTFAYNDVRDGNAFLQAIAKSPVVQAEYRAFRDGASGFTIDLQRQINIGADVPVVRSRYNLRSHVPQSEATEMANALRPRGVAIDGVRRGLEEMTAKIASISSNTLTLEEDCIPYDDYLKNFYAVKDNATFGSTQIVSTTAPNQIELSSATGFSAGHKIMFRETSGENGREVTTVLRPDSIDDFGYVEKEYSPPSAVYGLRTWIEKGDFPDWSGGTSAAPDGWTAFKFGAAGGGVAVSQDSTAAHIQEGAFGAKIAEDGAVSAGAALGVGLYRNFYVHRRTGRSKFVAKCWVYFDSGAATDSGGSTVRLEVRTSAGGIPSGGQTFYAEIGPNVTDGLYQLVVTFDAAVAGANEYRLRVIMGGDPDTGTGTGPDSAISLTISAVSVFLVQGGAEIPFSAGNGSNVLRDAAILKLQTHGVPIVQHEVSLLDLSEQNTSDRITVGGNIRLVNPDLGTDEDLRVMAYRRVFRDPTASAVTLASRAQTLTQGLAAA